MTRQAIPAALQFDHEIKDRRFKVLSGVTPHLELTLYKLCDIRDYRHDTMLRIVPLHLNEHTSTLEQFRSQGYRGMWLRCAMENDHKTIWWGLYFANTRSGVLLLTPAPENDQDLLKVPWFGEAKHFLGEPDLAATAAA